MLYDDGEAHFSMYHKIIIACIIHLYICIIYYILHIIYYTYIIQEKAFSRSVRTWRSYFVGFEKLITNKCGLFKKPTAAATDLLSETFFPECLIRLMLSLKIINSLVNSRYECLFCQNIVEKPFFTF